MSALSACFQWTQLLLYRGVAQGGDGAGLGVEAVRYTLQLHARGLRLWLRPRALSGEKEDEGKLRYMSREGGMEGDGNVGCTW